MYCPMCGAKNPDYARFCARCGASLEGSLDQHGSEPVRLSRLESNRGTRPDTGCTGPDARPQMRAAASSDQLPSSPPRRSRKGIAIVTVLVAVLAAVVTFCALRLRSTPSTVAVFPSGDESDGGSYYTAEGNLLCGIRLAADRTHAYVGDEDGSVTLTLSVPDYATSERTVRIVDSDGNEVSSLKVEDMEEAGGGWRTYELAYQMDTSEDGVTGLHATAGPYYSPELEFYVTPHITADQIAESVIIGMDCNEAMQADHADDTDEERAVAAQAWLDADERVSSTSLEEESSTVYFVTTDCVGGAFVASESYSAEQAPGTETSGIGTGDSRGVSTEGDIVDLYKQYEDADVPQGDDHLRRVVWASEVGMNTDCLGLVPTPGAMSGDDDTRARYINTVKRAVNSLSNDLGGNATYLEGNAAVGAIIGQRMNDFGFVTLFTHGSMRQKKEVQYLMQQSKLSKGVEEKDLRIEVTNSLKGFAESTYGTDSQGKGNFDDFYSQWYGEPEGSSGASDKGPEKGGSKLYITTAYNAHAYEIWMTSGYIMDRYQNQWFDNTIMYLACCESLKHTEFNNWLLNHGCSYVFGYMIVADTWSNMALLKHLTSSLSTKEGFKKMSEVRDAKRLDVQQLWIIDTDGESECDKSQLLNSDPNWVSPWFWYISPLIEYDANQASMEAERKKAEAERKEFVAEPHESEEEREAADVLDGIEEFKFRDNTLYYMSLKEDYVLSGTGVVRGRVWWQDVDENDIPLAGSEPEPVSDALVRAHQLLNRQFDTLDDRETTTAADGTFSMPTIPMGNLVLTAEAAGVKSEPYQLYLADDEWDGGDIYIKRHRPVVHVHVKDVAGSAVTGAKVKLTGSDGTVYEASYETSSEDESFKAVVTPQHYEVKVTPDDKHLLSGSVEIDVPNTEPWSHHVTVTLQGMGDITGAVYDAQTKDRLPGVEVGWTGPSGEGFVQTESDGTFRVESLSSGEYTLTFKKFGYQTQSITAEVIRDDPSVPDVMLEPEVVPEGAACSACIGAFDGTTYMIEPLAEGIELLPTPCARYDYICSFAFHNGKIYYCCKEAGTALCRMALYESDVDGSNARELYAPGADVTSLARFAVDDGMLYYREYLNGAWSIYTIELDTCSRYEAQSVPEDAKEYLDAATRRFGDQKVLWPEEGSGVLRVAHADGSVRDLDAVGGNSLELNAVVPIAGEDDAYVYYSASEDGYRTYNLYRKRLSGGEREVLGSRPAAGGGGYFAW